MNFRVIQGKPAPVITWSFDHHFKGEFKDLFETEDEIHIDHVGFENIGTYKCNATNEKGTDNHNIRLFIMC